MPRMIDLIRQSAVPANIMRSAARGALSVPAAEMIEILVALSTHSIFGEQARMTLASWDKNSLCTVVADSGTSREVLDYITAPQNLRLDLLEPILQSSAVPDERIAGLLVRLPQGQVDTALACGRVRASERALQALSTNPSLDSDQADQVRLMLASGKFRADVSEDEVDESVSTYLRENEREIKEAEGSPFQLLGATTDEDAEVVSATSSSDGSAAAAVRMMNLTRTERESVVQKIARLSVGERVLLAMKGSKDERFILIRDGARVVSSAVLESPKLTDSEVESFAGMKNVSESVLRGITMKRKFMKNYNVIRVVTMNPRCPIDVSVPLLAHLLTADLKNLSMNKNVADTVRKMAFKLYRDRLKTR